MAHHFSLTGGEMDAEEAAAAIAAVTCLLEEETAATAAVLGTAPARWISTARLLALGLTPTRLPVELHWSRIERLRRAGRGGGGIVGQ